MALRSLCVCTLLAGVALGARAAGPAAADDAAVTLDQTIQALKDEVVQYNRDALMAEEAALYPPQTRVAIHVSNSIRNLLLSEITLTLGDGEPVSYRYGDFDSRALLEKGAMQRLLLTNVDRGQHLVKVSWSGNFVDADDEPEPVSGQLQAVFTKGLEATDIELKIVRGSRRSQPAMQLKEWRAAEE